MGRQPSAETQLRSAKREIVELRKQLSKETQNSAFYSQRAAKAEAEASQWKTRFDLLLTKCSAVTQPDSDSGPAVQTDGG